MKAKSIFTGQEGLFYLMYQLARRGVHAASTQGNAPFVDIIASAPDGRKSIAIQVKTTSWALRWRGKKGKLAPHHLEFPLGHAAAVTGHPELLLAFIDLKRCDQPVSPDIYFVPSIKIKESCAPWADKVKMWRWHPLIETVEQFKNNWPLVDQLLNLDRAISVEAFPEDKVEIQNVLEK
jgi:hypothetical protein